ncbi:MAG: LysR family transcriptional regulator [Eubacterium sp.]|nr:LysR family transcriptional regulator [Eubacterium sp.]
MEIRVLEYFLAVAREQSFSKAAEMLHLTQPTLSRQLKELENELGKQLFIRSSKKISLTDDGMMLRKRAEEIIDLVRKTESEITNDTEQISGDIYIGAGETDGVRILARAYKNILESNPDIHLHISSGDSLDVLYDLDKGLVDFGLILGEIDTVKYDYVELPCVDTWGVLMRRDSELADKEFITAQDLEDKPLIMSRQAKNKKEMNSWFNNDMDKLNIVATNNLVFNASLMADEKIGYVLTLDKLINTANSNLKFIPLKPSLTIGMKLIWKKYRIHSKAVELFLTELKKII